MSTSPPAHEALDRYAREFNASANMRFFGLERGFPEREGGRIVEEGLHVDEQLHVDPRHQSGDRLRAA